MYHGMAKIKVAMMTAETPRCANQPEIGGAKIEGMREAKKTRPTFEESRPQTLFR